MGKRAMHFNPQVLLSTPRRSAGVPNPSGTKVLYTTSSYSFETHKTTIELRVLDIKSGESTEVARDNEVSDLNWLDDDEFVCLQAEKDSTTSLYWGSIGRRAEKAELGTSHYVAGKIGAPASNLKIAKLDDGDFAVVVSAQALPDGSLFNPEKAKKTYSTGRLYSSLFVRHWDQYIEKERNALFYAKLSKDSSGKYDLSPLTNALKGTKLECPVPPFGGTDQFDISSRGIIFVSKDPDLNPALNTKSNVYIAHLDSWEQSSPPKPQQVVVPHYEGASTSPVFSPDGSKAAFLSMKQNGYEADNNHVFVLTNVDKKDQTLSPSQLLCSDDNKGSWDRSPQSICFAADNQALLAIAEEMGNSKVFTLETREKGHGGVQSLSEHGSISEARPLANGLIFVSGSSLVDNSFFAILDPTLKASEGQTPMVWTHSNSGQGKKLGLKPDQVSSIWTPASNPNINKEVHSWVFKPGSFEKGKKYPVAYLIHGGPQGSWADCWSTRWNPAVFAEQGYIVVAPNPTGSIGYGQEFTDAIRKNWGGDPYEDIVKCFDWVSKNVPEADNEKAVALGASFGGYMMNWIQGHELGRKFKALVCHDGIFSLANMFSTEELYFPLHDFGGTPWYDPGSSKDGPAAEGQSNFGASSFDSWRKWDPSEYLSEWKTPQLVIHSSKDYRLCISEGLAAFNVLQARGVDSQFLAFPDENHWVLKPENSLAWQKTVLNWINKYVGLPAFTAEDPDSEDYWGGVRDGKPET